MERQISTFQKSVCTDLASRLPCQRTASSHWSLERFVLNIVNLVDALEFTVLDHSETNWGRACKKMGQWWNGCSPFAERVLFQTWPWTFFCGPASGMAYWIINYCLPYSLKYQFSQGGFYILSIGLMTSILSMAMESLIGKYRMRKMTRKPMAWTME